ncbi:MAG: hypothetical protein R6X12_00005, partial [bacterium]
MIRKSALAVLIGLIAPTILLAGMKFYEVVPYRNYIGLTDSVPPNNQISQTFINVADSLTEVSLWVGDTFSGGRYHVVIKDGNTEIASKLNVPAQRMWGWVHFDLEMTDAKLTRGRTLTATFTREGGAPISFAYDPTDPYPHGSLTAPGVPDTSDLALRVYGIARTENNLFGSHLFQLAMWRDWRQGANPVEGWDAWSDSAAAVGIGWAREGLEWESLQPESGGGFNFAGRYDTAMFALRDRGIKPYLILCYTPKWASSRVESTWVKDDTAHESGHWEIDT